MSNEKHIYRVNIRQTLSQDYLVRADSPEEADEVVAQAWEDGTIDASTFELEDTSTTFCEPGRIHLEVCKYLN